MVVTVSVASVVAVTGRPVRGEATGRQGRKGQMKKVTVCLQALLDSVLVTGPGMTAADSGSGRPALGHSC